MRYSNPTRTNIFDFYYHSLSPAKRRGFSFADIPHLFSFFKFFQKNLKKSLTSPARCAIIYKVRETDVPVAQLDRVTGYEPVGRGFESLQARQISPIHSYGADLII